jgi:hypothetical protein
VSIGFQLCFLFRCVCIFFASMGDATTKKLLDALSPEMKSQLLGNTANLQVVSVGSLCSGSNITSMRVCDLLAELSQLGSDSFMHDTFTCESDKKKCQFIQDIARWLGQLPTHRIFVDIQEMGSSSARCFGQGSALFAIPPAPLITTCGFSCKNLSGLYYDKQRAEILDDMLRRGSGTSGKTFQGMLTYLKTHKPPFHIWENVPSLQNRSKCFAFLFTVLEEAGYVCASAEFNTADFHLPQDRLRVYGICVHVEKSGFSFDGARALAAKILDCVKSMKCPWEGSLHDYLCQGGDP